MQPFYILDIHIPHSAFAFFPQTLLLPERTAFTEEAPAQRISLIHSENTFLTQAFLAAHHPNPHWVGSLTFSLLELLAFLRGEANYLRVRCSATCWWKAELISNLQQPSQFITSWRQDAVPHHQFPSVQRYNKHPCTKAEYRLAVGNVLSSHKAMSDWVGVCTAACSRLLWFCGSDRGLKLPVWLFLGTSHLSTVLGPALASQRSPDLLRPGEGFFYY